MYDQVVYPNAPVVLVALEIRHPTAEPMSAVAKKNIKKLLSSDFPIERQAQLAQQQILPGTNVAPDTTVETFPRYMSRDKTMAISIRREALVVETTRYPGWEVFRAIILRALEIRMDVAPVVGIERIGLRYIDEIRVPGSAEGDVHWADWVHPTLLGPKPDQPVGIDLDQWQGLGVYGAQPGKALILRYGPRVGYAVDVSSDLRRVKQVDPNSFFMLDIDSFWVPEDEIPEYDSEQVYSLCNDLHAPVRALFEGLITRRLRNEVLRAHD